MKRRGHPKTIGRKTLGYSVTGCYWRPHRSQSPPWRTAKNGSSQRLEAAWKDR